MNTPIIRLFLLVCLLFGLLVAFTSRWTVFEASALRDNANNRRDEIADQKIRRGVIRAADGTLMARSRSGQGGAYERIYPNARLFSHITGYSSPTFERTGLEQEYNDELAGKRNEISTVIRQFEGRRPEGDDLVTNLDPKAQRVAEQALAGRKGAVVAIEPETGKVRVLAAIPTYDQNELDRPGVFRRLNADNDNSPLLFRATQGGYAPGSTFKVITATAALDSSRYTPDSIVDGDNGKVFSGVPLNNFGSKSWGDVSLTTALTNSVNTVWARVGVDLGRKRMREYMERYGFYAEPDIDLPSDQLLTSGVRRRGRLVRPTSSTVDLGRMAIGQDQLFVTPLQMATVAATIANGGVRMKPLIADKTVDQDGRTVKTFEPQEDERVMSESTARKLTVMMRNVVKEGTGTAAALQGVELAGKTGTAERNIAQRINQPWFIGFTGKLAIAVTIERVVGGQGGTDAAPIAKQVLQALGSR